MDYLNQLSNTSEAGLLGIYPVSGYEIYLKDTEVIQDYFIKFI